MSKKGREERHMKELRDAFDAADKDKDGKLSPHEWLQVLKITGVDANWWVIVTYLVLFCRNKAYTHRIQQPKLTTLKSLIEEHARLDFSDILSTLLTIFHAINEKVHPARLLIYLVNKWAG